MVGCKPPGHVGSEAPTTGYVERHRAHSLNRSATRSHAELMSLTSDRSFASTVLEDASALPTTAVAASSAFAGRDSGHTRRIDSRKECAIDALEATNTVSKAQIVHLGHDGGRRLNRFSALDGAGRGQQRRHTLRRPSWAAPMRPRAPSMRKSDCSLSS